MLDHQSVQQMRKALYTDTRGEAKRLHTAAEIGVGNNPALGSTSFKLARIFNELHLFDFEHILKNRSASLARCNRTGGYATVVTHGNSPKAKDSYAYSIKRLLRLPAAQRPVFDYVYIDGAHEWMHDGFAFLLMDMMLRPGGVVDFDDYAWSIASSATAGPRARADGKYTEEQMNEPQVKEVVDLLVLTNPRYSTVETNRRYVKLRNAQ